MVATVLSLVTAVEAAASPEADCAYFNLDDLRASVDDIDVIVVGEYVIVDGEVGVQPEAFLKGSAVSRHLPWSRAMTVCDTARAPDKGSRVIVALRREGSEFAWPVRTALFVVEGGIATGFGDDAPVALSEDELVSRIREVSGQYAVLATDASEGASIDWLRVVLPVTLAAIVILAIALVLLRIWHRIDPEG